jgi:DNA-binding NarL/FixJ family response regulator
MTDSIRVLLVDDHAILREGLRSLLENVETIDIVGEAANGDEAVAAARRIPVDVVLMDLKMPGLPAVDAIRVILSESATARVLVLTSLAEEQHVAQVIAAGALGYVLKDVAKADLVKAIEAVARGETWLDAEAQRSLLNRVRKPTPLDPVALLTDREQSVLRLIAKGQSNKEIGRSLNLTEGTVKGYVSNVLAKLRLSDRTQAALFAVKHGLDGTQA